MKKLLRLGVLCALLVAALCVGALAVGEKGIYGIAPESKFTITAVDAAGTQAIDVDNNAETAAETVSLNAVKVSVTYTDESVLTTNQYFLVVTDAALTGSAVPTEGNIQYVQQDKPASGGSITFSTVYPKSLTSGKTYYIYLSYTGGSSLTLAGTFKYYSAYTPGDANCNGYIGADDALMILDHLAGAELTPVQTLAADANANSTIGADDSLWVLEYLASH